MTSLNHYNNLCFVTLHFPTTSASGSGDSSYCKKQETEIKNAKNELEKFKDNSEEKSKKEKELKKLQSEYDEHINKDHPLDESTRKTKIEEVKKQQKFVTDFQTNFNNALDGKNNILVNLCDGLQTFLGYDKTSKGYDGSGIVYSDLDRLCDGVMGFLYGVLSNIHKHLGQHKGEITGAINTLEQNKHRGKKGFNVAIAEVVKGVRGYNTLVERSNNEVKNPIDELLKFTKHDGKLIRDLRSVQVENIPHDKEVEHVEKMHRAVNDSLEECRQQADTFIQSLDGQTENINNLNPKLRDTVINVLACIKHERERLSKLAEKESADLEALKKGNKTKLEALKGVMNGEIDRQIKVLVKLLKARVKEIWNSLNDISNKLGEYISALDKWIKDADKIVNTCIADAGDIEKKEPGKDNQKRLEAVVKQINKGFIDAKAFVKPKVDDALQAVKDMDEALKKDLKTVKDNIKAAVRQLGTTLDKNVKDGLWTIEQKITEPLGGIVLGMRGFSTNFAATKEAIEQAIGIVQRDLQKLWNLTADDGIRNAYGTAVDTSLLKDIATIGVNPFEPILTYLSNLEKTIMTPFKNVTQTISEKWQSALTYEIETQCVQTLKNLVEAPSSVLTFDPKAFQKYGIDMTRDIRQLNLQMHATSILQLVKRLNTKSLNLQKPEVAKILTELGGIGETVTKHVNHVVEKVISKIQEKIEKEIGDAAEVIRDSASKIQTGIGYKQADKEYDYGNGKMENVRGLHALVENFNVHIKQAVETLQQTVTTKAFVHKSPGPNNQDNYEFGDSFMSAFNDTYKNNFETGDFKTDGGAGKSVLNQEIGGDILLPTGNNQKIAGFENDKFTHYREQVNQDTLSLSAGQVEGTLPNKIKEIDQHGLSTFKSNLGATDREQDDITTGYLNDITTNLSALTQEFAVVGERIKKASQKMVNMIGMSTGKAITGSLQEIQQNLKQLPTEMDKGPIAKARDFVEKYADAAGRHITKELHDFVNKQTDNTLCAVNRQAQKNFVTSIRDLLTAFAKKAEKELKPLPQAITNDLELGHKGFMKKMQQHFIGTDKGIKVIKDINTTHSPSEQSPLSQAAAIAYNASRRLCNYLKSQTDFVPDFQKYEPLHNALLALLDGLKTSERFNHQFRDNLETVKNTLGQLAPQRFGTPSTHMLQCLKEGIGALVTELGKAYISAYDSETFADDLVNEEKTLTTYGKYYAKVFLTALRTLDVSLYGLKHECKSLTGQKINSSTDLGRLFVRHGFKVAEENKEHCELQNRTVISGAYVANRLTWRVSGAKENEHLKECESKKRDNDYFNVFDILRCLVTHVQLYYDVCHQPLRPKSRLPCNVNEMLVWFTGLPHHPVYEELIQNSLSAPFENQSKQTVVGDDGLELTLTDTRVESITAHPSNITYNSVYTALQHLCTKSRDLLTTVMGHGNAETVYAVDFHTNYFNLKYPTSGDECLQTILDILRRMLPPLRYLYYQCSLGTIHGGWAQCLYGRDIKTSKWPCKTHSTDEPKCQPNGKVTCQPNCQPTSPLMSYLGDCLIGHLPHKLTTIGCRSVCSTCPSVSKLGMPCITPLGFRAFSGSTKTGRDIYEILRLLFGSGLVSSLLCLVPSPPSTLPEHFQFALALTHVLHNTKNATAQAVTTAFNTSINSVSIDLYKDSNKLTGALNAAYGSSQSSHDKSKHNPKSADMSSLSMDESCMLAIEDNVHCGPYLQTLFCDWYYYMAEKHTSVYLSWAVYLPWTLYDYLKSLFDSYSSISCQDWGCSTCLDGSSCKPGKHGDGYGCKCRSLVGCRGVLSTLYSYGFTFGDAKKLLADTERRYCRNLYAQLQKVLKSQHFTKLFEECDNFIWTIREPFTYLVLALWSLSLFYLLCVMVGRLDVLHIRSHLRIPSSHKITAQSLLAAAQVGRLAKISYLQP